MKRRFILYRRKRGGMFYLEDTETRKQESTGTRNRAEATSLLNARNESVRQPQLNLQIAKAYLAGTDSGVSKRTWQDAFNAITENKHGSTQERWQRAVKQKAFDLILPLIIIETQAEQLFACLKAGTVSTNVHLRELHKERLTGNFVAAQFTHDTSRALDPHLHTHCIVFNATFDAVENRWKALENYELLRARKFAENIYYHEFARDLRSFGYQIRNLPRGDFQVEGVSEELCRRFSKRDAEIDAALAKLLADHPELGGANM